ncbi:HEXXH motif-containing putative peptide modification protein [Lentzea sp. NPDC003310]|uniref:aKG-HExxH-type peptide beta-hydroxylase n=1 Tax=Lentzea sp. NPDC003310 TaxID=3154447 RepID=UPI0033BD330F
MPTVASTHAMHAAIAPAGVLVDERRTLYRLAGEIYAPGARLSDNLLDHPAVRYELGRALAGHEDLDGETLFAAARIEVADAAGIAVVSDSDATSKLATPLRIIAPAGAKPQVLTRADGERFAAALALVAEAVELFRALAPEMSDDLLAHLDLFVVLKSETSGGVVSASTRYMPGLVLIDEPATAMEVAEALVHEGSHLKFFDFAVTRDFLDARSHRADHFVNSWSRVEWPMEQAYAAWHAYTALSQFALQCESQQLSPLSLLPKAHERAAEIGQWLVEHQADLCSDARWLLHALRGTAPSRDEMPSTMDGDTLAEQFLETDHLQLVPGVRRARAASGRSVAATASRPPNIFWLDTDATWVIAQFRGGESEKVAPASMLALAAEEWNETEEAVIRRLVVALRSLVASELVEPEGAPSHSRRIR